MSQTLPLLRLQALPLEGTEVRFQLLFPAPTEHTAGVCAPAVLEPGDGTRIELGVLCSPTPTTWREQRVTDLFSHAYPDTGTYTARLTWGDREVTTQVSHEAPREPTEPPQLPRLSLMDVQLDEEDPARVRVTLAVEGLGPERRLRIDGGAGQVYWLVGEDASEQQGEWTWTYAKPGSYLISVDVVDGEGFALGTLTESPVMVEEIPQETEEEAGPTVALPSQPAARVAFEEARLARGTLPVWLPFRYARPLWAGVRTYVAPGGGRVSRIVGPGTYFSIREETLVNGQTWYRTAGNDWVPHSSVALMKPSDLRGVELSGSGQPTPPPEPPPQPPPTPPSTPPTARKGVVTAYMLNVRARPGVRADNPPIDKLRQGTEVTIYEDTTYNGEVWYRIGENRWVHSGWVRVVSGGGGTSPAPVRHGVVTAYILNVRARPGVRSDNPPIDRLRQGTEVTIYEDTTYNGEVWYRIGENRWVHSAWVHVSSSRPRAGTPVDRTAATEASGLPLGWVVAPILNVRAKPGVSSDNPPIDEVHYKDVVPILEEKTVGGGRWYRIGQDRWVYGGWVGVARYKPRPAAIRSDELWVGVNLREQTLVAYEGDKPVFATLVATGLPQTPTVQGIFRTWLRLKWGKMSGGSYATGGFYYLEDVTWTCYFYQGYALHAAYWHDAFGRPRSHGCVNMSPHDAWWVFQWSARGGDRSPVVYTYWA